jgi:hypothetical protein
MSGTAPPGGSGIDVGVLTSASAVRRFRWSHWGAALALGAVVLALGVVDGFPLVALPLGVLLIGISSHQRWWWLGAAALVWALALAPAGGAIHSLSRGWALLLGGSFLAMTLVRPRWRAFSRSLAAVAGAGAIMAGWLLLTGGWNRFDASMGEHFRSLSIFTSRELAARFPESAWAGELSVMAGRMAELQGVLFPALLALQSLAALALVWWAFVHSRPGRGKRLALRPLREFRFNDALIWLVIGGLVLIIAPLGESAARLGYNLLLFMSALYALRGLAVFVFLARGAPTATSVVLGAVATLFFYPLVFTAALLVGLGDTWLDVRGRVVAAASRV